jgi:hypothetical protein
MAKNKYGNIASADAKAVSEEKLKVSFDYLDWESEEFFFHGMEEKYYQKFFECMTSLQSSNEKDITQQIHPSLSPKSIFNTNKSIKSSFPLIIVSKIKHKLFVQTRDDESSEAQAKEIVNRAFEISLSKNYGRVHGFVWNNVFNVVWFDPAHNLFPMKQGITKHKNAATVKCFSPEECMRLQEKIKELQDENEELLKIFSDS